MMARLKSSSTDIAYIDKVKHSNMSKIDAVFEFVDNLVQRNATNIKIYIDNLEKKFRITGDGEGMSEREVVAYCKNFKYHKSHDGDKYKISLRGVGSKDAAIRLSNLDDVEGGFSVFRMSTAKSADGDIVRMTWHIARNERVFQEREIDQLRNTQGFVGTTIDIDNVEKFQKREIMSLLASLGKAYASLINDGLNIEVYKPTKRGSDKYELLGKADMRDPMYLSELGDNINQDGFYSMHDDTMYYAVRTFKLHKVDDPDNKLKVKCVFLYVSPHAPESIVGNDYFGVSENGFFARIGKRYIDYGGNVVSFIGKSGTGGGSGRVRTMIELDGSNADVFGVQPNKSKGIIPFLKNDKLEMYEDNHGNDFVELMDCWHHTFGRKMYDNRVRTKGLSGTIPIEIAKNVYRSILSYSSKKIAMTEGFRSRILSGRIRRFSKRKLLNASKKELAKIDRKENITFIINRRNSRVSESFKPLDSYDETLFPSSMAKVLTKALLSNRVSEGRAELIIHDFLGKLKEEREEAQAATAAM